MYRFGITALASLSTCTRGVVYNILRLGDWLFKYNIDLQANNLMSLSRTAHHKCPTASCTASSLSVREAMPVQGSTAVSRFVWIASVQVSPRPANTLCLCTSLLLQHHTTSFKSLTNWHESCFSISNLAHLLHARQMWLATLTLILAAPLLVFFYYRQKTEESVFRICWNRPKYLVISWTHSTSRSPKSPLKGKSILQSQEIAEGHPLSKAHGQIIIVMSTQHSIHMRRLIYLLPSWSTWSVCTCQLWFSEDEVETVVRSRRSWTVVIFGDIAECRHNQIHLTWTPCVEDVPVINPVTSG